MRSTPSQAGFSAAALCGGGMSIDPGLLSSVSVLLGALVGGGASLLGTIYTQRSQDRVQRVASEIAKRETVYADFVMSASNLLLTLTPTTRSSWALMCNA